MIKLAVLYITLLAYAGTLVGTGVVLIANLPRVAKQKSENLSMQRALDSSLMKIIGIILVVEVIVCLPSIIALKKLHMCLSIPKMKNQ